MAKIQHLLDKIRTAIYGKEVRGSLADGLEAINKETEDATEVAVNVEQRQDAVEQQFDDVLNEWTDDKPISNEETIAARTNRETGENHQTLGQRLDAENKKVNAQLAETMKNVDERGINVLSPPSPFLAARGDGKTDDTERIQELLNYAQYNGGKVILPFGTYRTSKTLIVPGGVVVEGVSKSNYGSTLGSIIRPFKEFAGDSVIQLRGDSEKSTDKMSIGVKNLKIDGQASDVTHGVKVSSSSSNIELHNVKVIHCENGFTFDYCWNVMATLLNTHRCENGFIFINGGGTSSEFNTCVAYRSNVGFNIQDASLHYSSFNNCGVDDTDIGFKITSPIRNCTFYNCGVEKYRTAFYIDNELANVTLVGFSQHPPEYEVNVFEVESVQQLNLIAVQLITNQKIFTVNHERVVKGAIRLTSCDIRTIDGRSMGDINCVVDLDNPINYDNVVNMPLFANRNINMVRSTLRINRNMRIILPVKEERFWASVRIITHGFNNPVSDDTGGLITLSAYNDNGRIMHKYTNTNENNYIEPTVVDGAVEFMIRLSHDRGGNFVICEIEGYCYKDKIKVYRIDDF